MTASQGDREGPAGGVTERDPVAARPPVPEGATAARALLDGLLLSVPPVVLVCAFLLPRATREALVFSYASPGVVTALSAAYVHFSVAHLATNVLGYLLVASVAYLQSRYGGFGGLFRAASVAFLVGLAPALSLLNLAVPRPGTAFGFSGVAMGFYGLLCFSLGRYVERRVVGTRAGLPAVVFFVAAAVAAVVVAPRLPVAGVAVALAAVGVALSLRRGRAALHGVDWGAALRTEPHGSLVVAGVVLVVCFPLAAFPADPRLADGVVNVYAHFLGFAIGFLSVWLTDLGTAPRGR